MPGEQRDVVLLNLPTYTLTVATGGTGIGTVEPTVGTHTYLSGTVVPLTATPGLDSVFVSWDGDISGSTNPTSITMDGDKTVTATFDLIPEIYFTLTIATDGTGVGTVEPTVGTHIYLSGTVVPLTATPGLDSVFVSWDGDISGSTNPTSITMDGDKTVTAIFGLTTDVYYTLTVATAGSGTGTVAPSVGTHSYLSGTVVPITATPDPNLTFTGWAGDLSDTVNPTDITMDGDKTVTANFTATVITANIYLPLVMRQ